MTEPTPGAVDAAAAPAVITVPIYDATHANIGHMPAGQHAGYTTGTPDVQWTAEDWQAHPQAVRIDQTPATGSWDGWADVQDFEKGAVTLLELPARIHAMQQSYKYADRPGQRSPAVYVGARPNATDVVNALVGYGITSGVGLAIAAPGATEAEAVQMIESTHGTPWPIIWVQYQFNGTYDAGVASKAWLDKVSVIPAKPEPKIVSVTLHFNDGSVKEFT